MKNIFNSELRKLRLGGNTLTSLSDEIGSLTSLEEVVLENNDIKRPPQTICDQGLKKLMDYLKAMKALHQLATKVNFYF